MAYEMMHLSSPSLKVTYLPSALSYIWLEGHYFSLRGEW